MGTATHNSESRGAVWGPGRNNGCNSAPLGTAWTERHHPGSRWLSCLREDKQRERTRTLGGAESVARPAAGSGGGPGPAGLCAVLGTHAQTGRGAQRHRGGGTRKRGGQSRTYFRSGGQIIPAKGEARPSGPLTVWGESGEERGVGKGGLLLL